MSRPPILFLPLLFLYLSFNYAEGRISLPKIYFSQSPFSTGEDALSFSEYRSSVLTFANVPHINCRSPTNPYDIAILGAPFDTGTTGRPGARFGPGGIREGSRRLNTVFGYNIHTHKNPFKGWAKIVDCGDAPLTYLDNTVALRALEQTHRLVSGNIAYSSNVSLTPRLITLGGDHTTTLPALRSIRENWGPVAVIHFDSHLDTWDPKIIGGNFSKYAGYNHGTFLGWAKSEGLILNNSIHAGTRGPVSNPMDDLAHDRDCGFRIITARDIDHIGPEGVIKKIKERVGELKVYISVDIDVLDPAFAPATGTAEPGGWTTRELLTILDGLTGLRVVGADVVEVAPIYDNPGQTTALAAAHVAFSLMTLMVGTPVEN